ncbi:hypothetical protein GCM10023116_03680 [Kistimonas scapharcae]|uniref:HTH cro/C1-type domain-containing protein n=1 Tax=Kistimonas scapharcae TaxID=1036133 RepID=A0ABP8UYA1_9GAMM
MSTSTLGERLRTARKQRGLTQTALARQVGTTQSTINDIETGRHKSTTYMLALADSLQVDPRWLERGTGVIKGVSVEIVNQGAPLPLYTWDIVAQLAKTPGDPLPMVDAVYRCPVDHSSNAYTLYVPSSDYEHYLQKNDVLFVDPVGVYSNGDPVICVIANSGIVDIRQLVSDGVNTYLKAMNRNIPDERRLLLANLEPVMGGELQLPHTVGDSEPIVYLAGRIIFRGGTL